MTQSQMFSLRVKKLQQLLNEKRADLIFIKDSVDLFYLTGIQMSLGYLYLAPDKGCLFVDGRYFEMAKKRSPVPVEELSVAKMAKFVESGKSLIFERNKLSYSDFLELKSTCRKAKVKVRAEKRLVDQLRLIKEPREIQWMQNSAKLGWEAYQAIRKKLKPGMSERELAQKLEIFCLQNGASGMSFEPIIAFGKNSSLPHYRPGNTKLKENDIVLVDLGVMLNGYASDMTRVDFIGKVDPKLREIFEVNKAAQKMALSKCRPGVKLKELDLAARSVMRQAGLEEYYIHGLGHGIGLEVHEYPRIRKDGADRNLELQEGMVITIEPGIYLPGKGGVRYEDTIVITKGGYRNFYPET